MVPSVTLWINSTEANKRTRSSTINWILGLGISQGLECLKSGSMVWHVLIPKGHLHRPCASLVLLIIFHALEKLPYLVRWRCPCMEPANIRGKVAPSPPRISQLAPDSLCAQAWSFTISMPLLLWSGTAGSIDAYSSVSVSSYWG